MLWGAFNNASSAMSAMSVDMGSVSQNISNLNTTGYKRTETMFKTVLSEGHAAPTSYVGGLNIFGVKPTQRNLIEAQGLIAASSNWSDLAIGGKGFFMVAPPVAGTAPTTVNTNSEGGVLYTRDGSWQRAYGADTDPNLSRNYFVSSNGGYLLGWMADSAGTIPANATLEPVYTLAPRPITGNGGSTVDPTATVPAGSQVMPGRSTTMASILANLPASGAVTSSRHTSTMSVTDPNGATQTMTLDWVRSATDPTQWTVTYSVPNATVESGTLAAPGGVMTVTTDALGNYIPTATDPNADPNTDSSIPANVSINWDDGVYGTAPNSTTQLSVASMGPTVHMEKIPVQVYDNNFKLHTVNLGFERTGNNSWNMYYLDDANSGDTVLTPQSPVQVTFDGNGKLLTPTGGLTAGLSWTGTNAGTASVNIDLSKLTQYADQGTYIGTVTQDGYGRGLLTNSAFNAAGELRGYFDNGQSRTLFKVAIGNFTAENSLEPISGNMFRRTAAAGDLTVSGIDEVPGESQIYAGSLEGSTVDLEDEFTRMIMTQKAYSTNAQVFKTADEMTSLARDLKR